MKALPYLLAILVLGAGAYAFFRSDRPAPPLEARSGDVTPSSGSEAPGPPAGELPPGAALPPGHPAVAPSESAHGPMGGENAEPAALAWAAPATWTQMPNPNPMRIATFRTGGSSGAEVTISRAGGSPEANIDRWVRQFEGASTPKRTQRRVNGIDVTVVEVSGTYGGGPMMMPGAPSAAHPDWTLVGAIAQPKDGSTTYFFKLLGPSADVHAAEPSFLSFLGTLNQR